MCTQLFKTDKNKFDGFTEKEEKQMLHQIFFSRHCGAFFFALDCRLVVGVVVVTFSLTRCREL